MLIKSLRIENFRGIQRGEFAFAGHTVILGTNNAGKSTICEALDLGLSYERLARNPPIDEYDFYNGIYLNEDGTPLTLSIEVLLIDIPPEIQRLAENHCERWDPKENRLLQEGELAQVDEEGSSWAIRLLTIGSYSVDDDEFQVRTFYAASYFPEDANPEPAPRKLRQAIGFLYLRSLRTGSRALSFERGSLLDIILRLQESPVAVWEGVRLRLSELDPPIDEGAPQLGEVLRSIENRVSSFIPLQPTEGAARFFVSQLTRENLRKTLSFFMTTREDQKPTPFQRVGTGTLNVLVLAMLSFIAELKPGPVVFAMEEPEIALPPHTQRRIVQYLLKETEQCFFTSHSPTVLECFDSTSVLLLSRAVDGSLHSQGLPMEMMKPKTYRRFLKRGLSDALLGRGVILVEGLTEQYALGALDQVMEIPGEPRIMLDLQGVTIFNCDGDGSVAEFGQFFLALGLRTFALLDKKTRSPSEVKKLKDTPFSLILETPYAGIERLLVQEVPPVIQSQFLGDVDPSLELDGLSDSQIMAMTYGRLKENKGWGLAAALLEACSPQDLPTTLTTFLHKVDRLMAIPSEGDEVESDQDSGTSHEA